MEHYEGFFLTSDQMQFYISLCIHRPGSIRNIFGLKFLFGNIKIAFWEFIHNEEYTIIELLTYYAIS